MSVNKRSGDFSREALDKLLDYLDGDRDRASKKYRELQRKLIALFEWQSCSSPEELADETLNRVARKLAEGLEIRTEEPFRYLRGVAFNVAKEDWKRTARNREALAEYRYLQAREPASEDSDERKSKLRSCLRELAPKDRELILEFYRGEKSARIEGRKRLAEKLGISRTALRIRAHRLRKGLEKCVERGLKP